MSADFSWETRRDAFRTVGACWCPTNTTLGTLRAMGHTDACTQARKGWEANSRHMSQIAQRREEERALGAALLEDCRTVSQSRSEVTPSS